MQIGANMATEWQEKEEQKLKQETRWAKRVEKFCRQVGTVAGWMGGKLIMDEGEGGKENS